MGARGPMPTPTKILEDRGGRPSHHPSRLNPDEPTPPPGKPTCPQWLGKEAKAEWRRIVKQLDAMGLLAACDRAALAAYCVAWEKFVKRYEADRDVDGAVTTLLKLADRFGLSPSARARVKAAPRQEAQEDDDTRFFGKIG